MSELIVIDSDNYAASGIETMFFPGGEPHVKVPAFKGPLLPYLKLRTWNDVAFGALVLDAVGRQRMRENVLLTAISLAPRAFIPYLPAARQDKSDGRAPLTLAVISRLFAGYRVVTFDVHNADAAFVHLPSGHSNLLPEDLLPAPSGDIVGAIAPDAGAVPRATSFRNHFLGLRRPVVECKKQRDASTGQLSNYAMPRLPAPGRYIVVDDICDGGGTFNLLAEAFKADPLASQCSLELFVSHGIFSKGLEAIDPIYERITTTDSWCRLPSNDRLTVVPLLPSVLKLWS